VAVAGIDHVQVAAPPGCERAARGFYGGLLGLDEIPKPAELAGRGGAWFACGAQQLHVGVEAEFAPAAKAHPALAVHPPEALDALAARLEAAGAPVTWDEALHGVRRFYTADPWGNRIELLAQAA
jgi:catechol 2,3-dioxygenase-like lactoylglutathione lyase family enzyme